MEAETEWVDYDYFVKKWPNSEFRACMLKGIRNRKLANKELKKAIEEKKLEEGYGFEYQYLTQKLKVASTRRQTATGSLTWPIEPTMDDIESELAALQDG